MLSFSRLLLLPLMLVACSEPDTDKSNASSNKSYADKSPNYVGASQCSGCHEKQLDLWQASHHDLAMQEANEKTILGDFNNASFDYFGTLSKFYKNNEQYFVLTDGPDGQLTEYPIAYTFGVYPLQQYLIKFPRGHYQALNIVWDTRSKEDGGQRWYHLYPDEHIKYDDELHWTGINHNWNYMCADCHSTHLQKKYDLANQEYKTSWSEIDVSCEACHGPASNHLLWASNKNQTLPHKGFSLSFNERQNISWPIDPVTGNAKRSHAKTSNTEIQACAQCHSRRSTIKPETRPEHALLDNYRVALLTEPLYHADGQINGEVYVYGSFIQSKMYHSGVTCSDCHEPHSLKLRAKGNDLCAKCHLPTKYASQSHHLHKPETESVQCTHCHMPQKTYMGVDARADHSIRIPRPDLSVSLGVPNACAQCHNDKSAQWAASKLEQKHGKATRQHFAHAINSAQQGTASAPQLLAELIVDDTQPAIARATAVTLLTPYLSQQTAPLFQLAANDEQALLSFGVATALANIPQQRRLPFAYPLLYDDNHITRLLAARSLLGYPLENLPLETKDKYNQAINDYEATQLFNADRPESLVNLAGLYAQQGKPQQAIRFYRKAITLAPYFVPAYTNLADLYRNRNDEQSGEKVLREALISVYDKTGIQHALGLLLVRQNNKAEALKFLELAAKSKSTSDRYIYVYAIALNSVGQANKAIDVLELALHTYPNNTDILYALVSINNESGNTVKAEHYDKKIREL